MTDASYLRSQAAKCRAIAKSASDPEVAKTLLQMAGEYEAQSEALEPPVITVKAE